MSCDYLNSIDNDDPHRNPPFSVGDLVVYRKDSFSFYDPNNPMLVLEYQMIELNDNWELERYGHDYRFYYILLDGNKKIERFEENLLIDLVATKALWYNRQECRQMDKELDVLYEIGEAVYVRTLDNMPGIFGTSHKLDIEVHYTPGVVLTKEFKLWQVQDQEPYWKYTVLVGDKKRVVSEFSTRPIDVDTDSLEEKFNLDQMSEILDRLAGVK